jgi:hypothetical protein
MRNAIRPGRLLSSTTLLLMGWTASGCTANTTNAVDDAAGGARNGGNGDGGGNGSTAPHETGGMGGGGATGGGGSHTGGTVQNGGSAGTSQGGVAATGGTPAGGTPAGGTPGTGGIPVGRIPMFVAAGDGLRTTISCDDGRTWVANQFEKATDDDFSHDETSVHTIVYTNQTFFYVAGWGFSTTRIFSSSDGVAWTRMYLGGGHEGSSLAAGQGALIFGEGDSLRRSTDWGATWSTKMVSRSYGHASYVWGDVMGGRFVVAGDNGTLGYSTDGGETFRSANRNCGRYPRYGGGVFLSFMQWGETICRSTDGGATWQDAGTCCGTRYIDNIVWDGRRFLLYNEANEAWASADGAAWTKQVSTGLFRPGSIARNPETGTFVASAQGWISPAQFYRSADGLNWVSLPTSAYTQRGANIKSITFGYGLPSAACPAR